MSPLGDTRGTFNDAKTRIFRFLPRVCWDLHANNLVRDEKGLLGFLLDAQHQISVLTLHLTLEIYRELDKIYSPIGEVEE